MFTYIILILDLMIDYINENKIYNMNNLYHYVMSVYLSLFFFGLSWHFTNRIIYKTKNKVSDYVYTNIYDYFFGDAKFSLSTPNLFYYTISRFEPNSKVLDFGCGNGICYSNTMIKDIVINNNLQIQGIDIDKVYIEKCIQRIKNEKLESNIKIKLQDVLLYKEDNINKYDYIIFSESAPLISTELLDQILNHMINNLLKSDGKIIFINNLTENPTDSMIKIKPMLKYFCMIDFGRVLTKREFNYLAVRSNKKIEFNLINKMKIRDILKYFKLEWTYLFWNMIGIKNYEVEQYEIKFF